MKSVGIIGVGGVGGYFGGKLCRLQDRVQISFLARGAHLRAIQEAGLLLSSETEGDLICVPALATDDFARLPRLDLCLICVKEFDLPGALARLKPLIGRDTIILPLLNGVDVSSRVRSVISKGVVLPACVYVGTHIERPGKVYQKGGACKILFGPDPLRPDFKPDPVLDLFSQAGIKSEWTLDIEVEIWKKFIFICAYGLVSAASGQTLGAILENERWRNDVELVMREIIGLAESLGVRLPGDILEVSMLKARSFPYEAKTSFQRDFERDDKRDERDLFAGAVLRLGAQHKGTFAKTREIAALLEARKPAMGREGL